MQFRTCFSSVCESGYGIDAIKSGIQKYLRRREPSKMKWCVKQMQMFAFGNNEIEKQVGKGIITNLVNRLIIMLDEDMVFADWETYLHARSLLEKFQKDVKDIAPLYELCDVMCNSRLLRYGSDVACYYGKAVDGLNDNYEVTGLDSLTIQDLFERFVSAINDKDIHLAYTWAFALFHNKRELTLEKKIYRRDEPIYILWQYIINETIKLNNNNLLRCLQYRLEEFYNKARPERKLFLVSAVALYFYRQQIDWTNKDMIVIESPIIEESEFKLDDYVLDMHCKDGRKLGKNTSDFANEGSLVVDEDKEYHNDEWRQYYIECKHLTANQPKTKKNSKSKSKETPTATPTPKVVKTKKTDNKPTRDDVSFIPMSDFTFVKLCTDQPCGKKVMCFVVDYQGGRYVLKEGRKSMNYNEDYSIVDAMKEIFGLNAIGMKRILSDKIMKKTDETQKSWVNNWHFVDSPDDVVYTMMTYIEPSYRFNKAPAGLIGEEDELEYMKIGLFRGIFGVSDFNVTNVIIDDEKNVYSIDEHDFLGTREHMIGKMNMRYYKKHSDKIQSIFDDLYKDKENKKMQICQVLESFGYQDKAQNVLSNYDNLADKFWQEYNT